MSHPVKSIFLFFLILFAFAVTENDRAYADARVALVIGNSNYEHAPLLPNPKNDAELMATTLESAGFSVTILIDADHATLKRAMLDFGRLLRSADTEAGLFYYAGHGVQVAGENFLVPVSANISSEDEIDLEAINVNDFLAVMKSSKAAVNIIILDACRNNPFVGSGRGQSRGLAPVDAPSGTYIAYATSPGDVALDGDLDNSPYTLALSQAMAEPGIPIERVFKNARARVLEATAEQQVPWETSSITGEFYFHPESGLEGQPAVAGETASGGLLATESTEPAAASVEPDEPSPPAVPEQPQENVKMKFAVRKVNTGPAPTWPDEVCETVEIDEFSGEICASTALDGQDDNSYGPGNLFDDDHDTAWVEGADGDGIYETVLIRFDEPYEIYSVDFLNGYTRSSRTFSANGRVWEVQFRDSTGRVIDAALADSGDWQTIEFDEEIPVEWISIEIQTVYPGGKYADTAISELWIN